MPLSPRTRDLIFLSIICFICFFWRLGSAGLFDFNEGYYTSVAREMYLRGDYITPRFNGTVFFDKPPLALWLSAISFGLFGVNEFAARLPVAVAAVALIFLTYLFGARFLGRRAGFFAAAILALNPLFFATARQMTMDIHQTLWFAAAMYCYFVYRTSPAAARKWWIYGFWASCGLAFMAKSAPGIIPIIAVAAFILIEEHFRVGPTLRRLREMRPVAGAAILLAIVVPWFYLAWRANGYVFYREYFLHHHVQLLNGKDFNHAQPIWYYLPALLAGFFPWSLFLPWALRNSRTQQFNDPTTHQPDEPRLYLLAWAGTVLLLFTCMTSKLVSYMLPLLPAVALLVGDSVAQSIENRRPAGVRVAISIAALAAIACTVIVITWLAIQHGSTTAIKLAEAVPSDVILSGEVSLVLLALGFLAATIAVWAIRLRMGVYLFLGSCIVAAVVLVGSLLGAMERSMNAPLHTLAREAGQKMALGIPVAIHLGNPVRPSVFFYLPDTVIGKTILFRGEKLPIDEFLAANRPSYVLTDRKRADALLQSSLQLDVEDSRGPWVLIRAEPLGASAELAHNSGPGHTHL